MGTAAVETGIESRVHYLNASYGIKSWLLTTDHKRIALLYLISSRAPWGSIRFSRISTAADPPTKKKKVIETR